MRLETTVTSYSFLTNLIGYRSLADENRLLVELFVEPFI
jgi:hypothetical protein